MQYAFWLVLLSVITFTLGFPVDTPYLIEVVPLYFFTFFFPENFSQKQVLNFTRWFFCIDSYDHMNIFFSIC